MDCERVEALLAGRALGKALSAKVADHLDTCQRCGGELRRLETALSVLDREIESALRVDVSPELIASIRQELSAQPKPRESWSLRWAVAVVVGIAVMVLLVKPVGPPRVATEESAPQMPLPQVTGVAPSGEIGPTLSVVPPPTSTAASPEPSRSAELAIPEPEVLVPAGQEAAILAFHTRSTARGITLSIPRPRSALEELSEPAQLAIPALAVSPIVLADVRIAPLAGSTGPMDRKQRR